MPDTFIKIASVTVGSGGASSIDFTSIPSTYTDLCLKVSTRSTKSSTTDWFNLSINGSSSSFTWRSIWGDTSAASGTGTTSIPFGGVAANATANTFSNTELYIPNYTSSNYKSISTDSAAENNSTDTGRALTATLWSNTAAITSFTITASSSSSFVQYSTATLYGIKNS